MSSDIIVNLQLDKEFETSRTLIAKEINGCDSSFIVSCVLGHCVKNKKPVLVASFHNALSHYQNVGLKMNYNLQKHIESGLLDFYNVGEENLNILMSNEKPYLQNTLQKLKEKTLSMNEKNNTVNIIIDGISHLFDLQYTLSEVNNFCNNLIKIMRSYNGSFTLFHCSVTDDITHVMANLLSHKAHTVVETESLASGWSADVTGHLAVAHPGQKFQHEHMFTMDSKSLKYLFKLFDRGVKLFAPGTV